MFPVRQRGQVTIFIILGLIAILLIFLISHLPASQQEAGREIKTEQMTSLPLTKSSLEQFIQQCLEQTSNEGLLLLARQGGYATPPENSVLWYLDALPYYYFKSQTGPEKQFPNIAGEFKKYLHEHLPSCFNDFNAFQRQGADIEKGDMHLDLQVEENAVHIKMQYSLKVQLGDAQFEVSEFVYSLPVHLGKLLRIAQQITEDYARNPGAVCMNCLQDLARNTGPNVEMYITPVFDEVSGYEDNRYTPRDIFLVSLADKNFRVDDGVLVYRFALQNPATGAGTERFSQSQIKLAPLEDQRVRIGQTLRLDVDILTDNTENSVGGLAGQPVDDPIFSDETPLFDINPRTGKIVFTPTADQRGVHIVIISVADQRENSDRGVFQIEVE